MNKLVALFLVCLATPVSAQTKQLVERGRTRTDVTFEGFRSFALPTVCDAEGRLFVKLVEPGPGMIGPLLRLSSSGTLEAKFDTSGAVGNVYAVRPNGGVVMLRVEGSKYLDYFAPDGKRESSVEIESAPKPFFPTQIAVSRSGELLLAGLLIRPFYSASAAIYDRSGHLLKQFSLEEDTEIEHAIERGDIRYTRPARQSNEPVKRSVAISGDDGLVYLMRATSPAVVYAISSTGEVIHKLIVKVPAATGLPADIRLTKNKLAVMFWHECANFRCQGGSDFAVVDVLTGERLVDYESEKDVGGPLACFAPDPDRFYVFTIPTEQHRSDIIEARAK